MIYEHGQGTYTYTGGDKYVGEWKDDKNMLKELIPLLMEKN